MTAAASIQVGYCYLPEPDKELPEEKMQLLPSFLVDEILLYKKQDDRNRLLVGKLLLREAILNAGHDVKLLQEYRTDPYGRPYIPGFYDFNITHSGHIVACAVSAESRIGIDVEMMRTIRPEQFTKQFSPPEMQRILAAKDPQEQFFEFWTQKEAVMKADGRGMRIPLHSIRLRGDHATIDDRDEKWNLLSLDLGKGYKAHICSVTDLLVGRLQVVRPINP